MDVHSFDILLHDAELKLKRLRALYEQYFQGIERIAPAVARKDLDRLFHTLHKAKPRNTAARFRLQQLQASYNTYQAYWQRIVRQIEEGTYERDVRRARRRGGPTRAPTEAKTFEIDVDVDEIETDELLAALGSLATPEEPLPPEPKPAPRSPLTAFSPFAGGLGGRPPTPLGASQGTKKDTLVDDRRPPVPAPATGSLLELEPDEPARPRPPVPGAPLPKPSLPKPSLPRPSLPGSSSPRPPPSPRAASPSPPSPSPPSPSPSRRALNLPKPTRRPPPQPASGAERRAPDTRLKGLYDEYIAARRRNNEPTDNLRYEKLAASVQKMEAQLKQRHAGKPIDFEVVVRDGRVGLKPKIG